MKGSQGGREYDSGILLKSRIIVVLLFLSLILRLGEARVSLTNTKDGAAEKNSC